jgi:hypothetical protein
MKLPRGIFVVRGRIPGLRDENEDALIQSRSTPGFAVHVVRAKRRQGFRSRSQAAEDQDVRAFGVSVFDRNAGASELGGYLDRGRG